MTGADLHHYAARAISFTLAVTATWYLNRRWVFDGNARQVIGREYAAYVLVQVIGAAINLSVFIAVLELRPALAALPVIPLAIGAAAALLFNFLASSRFVFVNPQRNEPESRA